MTKLEYSSCSGPSYTDLLPHASVMVGHDRGLVNAPSPATHGKHAVIHTLHFDELGHVSAEE